MLCILLISILWLYMDHNFFNQSPSDRNFSNDALSLTNIFCKDKYVHFSGMNIYE